MDAIKGIQRRFSIRKVLYVFILAIALGFGGLILSTPTRAFAATNGIQANYDTVVDTFMRVYVNDSGGNWVYSYTGYYTYKNLSWVNGYSLSSSEYLGWQSLDIGVGGDKYKNWWYTY